MALMKTKSSSVEQGEVARQVRRPVAELPRDTKGPYEVFVLVLERAWRCPSLPMSG
jgi:hypothetical protein